MTDSLTRRIKDMKKMSPTSHIDNKREIINEFLEKDLDIILIDSDYIDHYDKKTKEIIKDHGIKIEDFIVLDKNMFLLTLRAVDELTHLTESLKSMK